MPTYFDALLFIIPWLTAQVVFHGFEAHLPLTRRLTKSAIIGVILACIYVVAGKNIYYATLALMTLLIAILHGYYFQYRHGIHWRKAEPRERYLELVNKMKSRQF